MTKRAPGIGLALLLGAGAVAAGAPAGGATAGVTVRVAYAKRPCGSAGPRVAVPAPVTAGTVELRRNGSGRPVRVSLLDSGTAPARVSLAGSGPITATLVLETPRVRVVAGAPGAKAQRIPLGTRAPGKNGVVSFSVGRSEEANGHVNTLISLQDAARVAARTAPHQLPLAIAVVHDGPAASKSGTGFVKPNVIEVGQAGVIGQWEPTALVHEYGHFMLYHVARDDDVEVEHEIHTSYPEHPTLAWSEGFPSAFAAVVLKKGAGLLTVNCGPYMDLASQPAGPPLRSARDVRYAQYSETRVAGAAYQLIRRLGGGEVGLRRLLAALPAYRRAGHPVWTARDLRDLAVQRFEHSAADHAAIDRIFLGQGISWRQGVGVDVDRANPPHEVAASSEVLIRVTGPGGFDCAPKNDVDVAKTSKLDAGIALGEKFADGGLSYSADDDCYVLSGDGNVPNQDDPRPLGGEQATVPFPFLSNLAHWNGKFTVLAKYVCEFDQRFGPREVFECPSSIAATVAITSPFLLSAVPALRTPTRITLVRNAEIPIATFTADGGCQLLGPGKPTDCGTSLP